MSRRERRKQQQNVPGWTQLSSFGQTYWLQWAKGLENLCQLRADEIISMVASGCRSYRRRCEYDDELQVIRQTHQSSLEIRFGGWGLGARCSEIS